MDQMFEKFSLVAENNSHKRQIKHLTEGKYKFLVAKNNSTLLTYITAHNSKPLKSLIVTTGYTDL